jgi:carboxyl-terminal processing protease
METHSRSTTKALLLVLALALAYGLGRIDAPATASTRAPDAELANMEIGKPGQVDFAPFWKAWDVINEKFVPATTTKEINDQTKVWGAIGGLAGSLGDPYTVFLPPVEKEIFEGDVRGNFEGVGMEVGLRDGILTVVAPLKNTPAYRAGIESGDKIIEIDKTSTYNLSTDEAVSKIRGQKGTPVVFTILRGDSSEPIEITVVRDVINIPTLDTEMRPDGVFVISLYNFSSQSPDLFRQALRDFIRANTDKLVIDLRGNPGGYLEAAIDMASWFLPPGTVVVREDFGGKQEEDVYRSRGYDIFTSRLKLVILVDGGSASASEILAGALSEHGVAKVVGERTFGKGSVQELVPITADTSLKVTIARWLTPKGLSISASGIEPDFVVKNERPAEGQSEARDAQMDKAVEVLLNWGAN